MSVPSVKWATIIGSSAENTSLWPSIDNRLHVRSSHIPTESLNDSSGSTSDRLNRLTLAPPSTYDATADQRTREEILAERKQRKIQQKIEREELRIVQEIERIRAPKYDRIKIVDREEAERILNAANAESVHRERGESRRSKNVKYNLADYLDGNLSTRTHSELYAVHEEKVETKPELPIPKGKVREVPRPKNQSQLKKNILKSREVRNTNANSIDEHAAVQQSNPDNVQNSLAFSRNFRSYCNNIITSQLCDATENLLRDLFKFQDRAFAKNQIKARAHKRFVVGFKETQRQLHIDKLKLLIVAPDLEPTSTEDFGGA